MVYCLIIFCDWLSFLSHAVFNSENYLTFSLLFFVQNSVLDLVLNVLGENLPKELIGQKAMCFGDEHFQA